MLIDSFSGEHRFLSNFYPSPIEWLANGKTYPTVEHLYQARKVDVDNEWHERIRTASSAKVAKELGRRVPLPESWDEIKFSVMSAALVHKFTQIHSLKVALLQTGNQILIEGNTWHDQVWGDCTCGRPACREQGQNALGILLMDTRLRVRALKD